MHRNLNQEQKIQQEQILIAKLQQKDRLAYEELYDRYSAAIYGVVLRMLREESLAEDVLQETFIRVWRKIFTYDRSKGRFFTWLLNIARNLAIDKLRSKAVKHTARFTQLDQDQMDAIGPSATMSTDHIGLRDLLKGLRPEQQEVIQLIYFQGFTQVEAADELQIPLGTVKSRIRLAMKFLRGQMQT